MENNNTIIRATDYSYPSREELKEIYLNEPTVGSFNFEHKDEMQSLLEETELEKTYRYQHLFWWDNTLSKKIWNLSRTYAVALVNYNRGFPDNLKLMNHDQKINWLQFNLYAETYFYLFYTVKDIIGQILNNYFDLGFAEDQVYFGKIIKKVSDTKVHEALANFSKYIEDTKELRNSFTHRFPKTSIDYRPKLEVRNGESIYYAIRQEAIPSIEIANNIKQSYHALADLLDELRKEMPLYL